MRQEDLTQLKSLLTERFNLEELRSLAFDVGVSYEEFPQTLTPFVREFISYCERHDITGCLLNQILVERQWLLREYQDLFKYSEDCAQRKKIQIIVSAEIAALPKQEFLQRIAEAYPGVSPSDIELIAKRPRKSEALLGTDSNTANKLLEESEHVPPHSSFVKHASDFSILPPREQAAWRMTVTFSILHRLGNMDGLRRISQLIHSDLLEPLNQYQQHIRQEQEIISQVVSGLAVVNSELFSLLRLGDNSLDLAGLQALPDDSFPQTDSKVLYERLVAARDLEREIHSALGKLQDLLSTF